LDEHATEYQIPKVWKRFANPAHQRRGDRALVLAPNNGFRNAIPKRLPLHRAIDAPSKKDIKRHSETQLEQWL
jgi:hypothetical protein